MLETVAPILEIFESIQGEGKSIGKPSVFVRFFGCNLRCQFKGTGCDTSYAVKGKSGLKIKHMTVEELVDKIREFKSTHIVWTGGEPTLHQDFIIEVITLLDGHTCEVETNGTLPISSMFAETINQFNISLKLISSNQEEGYEKGRIIFNSLETFPTYKSYFKFVISDEEQDIKEIKYIEKIFPKFEIYLMPEGANRKDLIEHSPRVAKLCVENNWMFSPREHIMIWDTKKGV